MIRRKTRSHPSYMCPRTEAIYRLRMFRGDRQRAIASLERDAGRSTTHYLARAARMIRMGEVEWEVSA